MQPPTLDSFWRAKEGTHTAPKGSQLNRRTPTRKSPGCCLHRSRKAGSLRCLQFCSEQVATCAGMVCHQGSGTQPAFLPLGSRSVTRPQGTLVCLPWKQVRNTHWAWKRNLAASQSPRDSGQHCRPLGVSGAPRREPWGHVAEPGNSSHSKQLGNTGLTVSMSPLLRALESVDHHSPRRGGCGGHGQAAATALGTQQQQSCLQCCTQPQLRTASERLEERLTQGSHWPLLCPYPVCTGPEPTCLLAESHSTHVRPELLGSLLLLPQHLQQIVLKCMLAKIGTTPKAGKQVQSREGSCSASDPNSSGDGTRTWSGSSEELRRTRHSMSPIHTGAKKQCLETAG